ncbi:putative lipoprotein YerB precursor [mine drainage metagenome]|uniref:Putative lipoprotein YerB n=1 Tax=mine drainage metagenome TaxID=410659 RepID=A0A1J5PZP2_9ZZZZ
MLFSATRAARSSRRGVAALLGAGVVVALAACGSTPTAPSTGNLTLGPSIAPDKSAPPTPAVPPTWPLTGVASADVVTRPALTVKIENSIEARPQTGLDQADMVWEEVVEGGITRFAAVYQSAVPSKVGPVRSVRPMDAGISAPMHGLLAFSGGVATFVNAIKAAGVQLISMDLGSKGFERINTRQAPHNVLGTPSVFWSLADANHSASPAPQFGFAPTAQQASAVTAGTPVATIDIRMSGVEHPIWSWAANKNVFLRSEGSTPAVTSTGVRLSATNIVVLRVRMDASVGVDPAGNPIPETVMVDSGDAVVFSGGKQVAAKWAKESVAKPVVLTTASGAPILLAPGNTWIELVPRTSGSVSAS